MEKLKQTRILGIVGILGIFLGTLLPYFKISIFGLYQYNVKLWGYWEGKVIVLLMIASALFIFKDYVEKYVPQMYQSGFGKMIQKANPKMVLVPAILVAIFAIYLFFNIDVDSKYITYGIGFYVLWIGIISLVAHCFLYKGALKDTKNVSYASSNDQNIVPDQPVQHVKFCSKCGAKVDETATHCFMCGNPF